MQQTTGSLCLESQLWNKLLPDARAPLEPAQQITKSKSRPYNADFDLDLPRGMKDIEPDEQAEIELVRSAFFDAARLFGFSPIEPSPLELLGTMEAKSGPAIRDEIYHFKDKGDRDVALRFDFTVGLTRYVSSQKSMKMPAKFATFGGVFRYDEPQKGRYRYFHQWNVEIYGKPGIEPEAEIIEFASLLFDRLGFDRAAIRISHRRLIESLIKSVFGTDDAAVKADILRAIDKIAKKPRYDIVSEFAGKGRDPEKLKSMLIFAELSGSPDDVAARVDVSELDSWEHVVQLFDSIKNRGVDNAVLDLAIVRGLDYYSGTVFEIFDGASDIGALAGGGRYDSLAAAFGRGDVGAAGIAGGVERTILAMRNQKMPEPAKGAVLPVLYAGASLQKTAANIASILRRNGIPCATDLAARPLRKQMAAASDAKLALIAGSDELARGEIILRDMEARTETMLKLDQLLANPRDLLSRRTRE